MQKSRALKSRVLDDRRSMGRRERRDRKSEKMEEEPNENKERAALTHKLFCRDYFLLSVSSTEITLLTL